MKTFRSLAAAFALTAAALLLNPAGVAQAQIVQGAVVASCSAQSHQAGQSRPITLNTAGDLCTAGGGGGGGGGATGPGTAANASRVTYASDGSTVPVAGTVTANQGTAGSNPWLTTDQNISQSAVFTAASTITRPADTTAYTGVSGSTQGDLVANSTTAGSVTPFSFSIPAVTGTGTAEGYVTGVTIRESGRKARHTFRVHLFQTTAPTVSNGDNAAAALSNYASTTYLCYVDVVMDPSIGGQQGMSDDALCPYSKTSGATIYALIEAYDGYTPANAETIGVQLYANRTR